MTGLFCFLIIIALELAYGPYFFGDDNMQFTFVQMTEIGRNLLHGKSIFIHQHIFGGGFDMRADPVFLSFWNPLTLICSLLTQTPFKFWSVDVVIGIYIVAAGMTMSLLLSRLRRMRFLALSNILIVFLSASYACSGYSLLVCASWGTFSANIAGLPMFLIGVLHPRVGRGIAWVCFSSLLGLLAGHVDPLCYSLLFVFFYCSFLALRQRSLKPLVVLSVGVLLALIIASPLLWPAWSSFRTNPRFNGFAADVAVRSALTVRTILAGYFLGWFGHWAAWPAPLTSFLHPWATLLFSFSFSSMLVFIALRHWRSREIFGHGLIMLALLAILFAVRPPFISHVIARMPLFRSFSSPFRCLMCFHFFMVLWLASNIGRVSIRTTGKWMACGLVVGVLSQARLGRAAFSDYGDRQFIRSGRAALFFNELRTEMPPDTVVATIGTPGSWYFKYPLCLACGNNFPALYDVTIAGGYSPTRPVTSNKTNIPCDTFSGFFNYGALPSLINTYKRLYVIELAPHSALRMGLVDGTGKFVGHLKTINFAALRARDGTLPAPHYIELITKDIPVFHDSVLGNGDSSACSKP